MSATMPATMAPAMGPLLPRPASLRPRRLWRLLPAAGPEQPSQPSPSQDYEFTYLGNDGRLKATFEQAFKGTKGEASSVATSTSASTAPWAVGYQMSEKNLFWNDDLKSRLVKRVVAEQLQLSDEEVTSRLAQLQLLMPTLGQKLAGMRPQVVARLAADVPAVAAAMLQLKGIFPEADVGKLAVREPALVLGFDMERLRRIAEELRGLLPRLSVDRLVEENPSMLDVGSFKAAMAEAKRILPGLDIQQALANDPSTIFGFQRGSQLIPYDEPRPQTPEEQHAERLARAQAAGGGGDDDEYSAYYKW